MTMAKVVTFTADCRDYERVLELMHEVGMGAEALDPGYQLTPEKRGLRLMLMVNHLLRALRKEKVEVPPRDSTFLA